ncbi:MAG: response regulator [Acidobacteriota bacterium]
MQRILLVEDNEMNRDLISRRLRRRGFEVLLAADGAAGVETANRERPDLILMDIRLPVLDGYEATRLLKYNSETRDIPVIGLSAHAMSGDADRAREAGCDDYDTKPIDWPRLLDKMVELLERAAEIKAKAASEDAATSTSPGTGIRLLVVDDSAMRREMVTARLAAMGHAFVVVETVEEARTQLDADRFDGILLDVSVPGSSDESALAELLTATDSELPIFMLCAIDAVAEAIGCLDQGAVEILPQPFRADEVRHRLDSQLELARHRRMPSAAEASALERRRVEHLMHSALPPSWIDELRQQSKLPPRRLDAVTLLQWDLPELTTQLAATGDAALQRWQRLIVGFETLASQHGLLPITIDASGVLSMVDEGTSGPVDAAVRCALELADQASDAGDKIRAVVHTGPVFAAVLGHRTWRFGLFGPTVNHLRYACLNAAKTIHVTDAAKRLADEVSTAGKLDVPSANGLITLHAVTSATRGRLGE